MRYNNEDYNSKEFKQTLKDFEEALKEGRHPSFDKELLTDIAAYYHICGKDELADEAIDYVLELDPNGVEGNAYKARRALEEEHIEEAIEYMNKIDDKDDLDYFFLEAEVMICQGKLYDADKYLKDYGETLDEEEHQEYIMDCASIYADYGMDDKCMEWLSHYQGKTTLRYLEIKAFTLCRLNQYKEAVDILQQLVEKRPYALEYWVRLASSYLVLKDYDKAITNSEYALAIDPKNANMLLCKATALSLKGNYKDALTYFKRSNDIEPGNMMCMMSIAYCYNEIGKPGEAMKYFQQSMENNDQILSDFFVDDFDQAGDESQDDE